MYGRKKGVLELAFSACFLIDRGRRKNKPTFYRKIFESLLRDTFTVCSIINLLTSVKSSNEQIDVNYIFPLESLECL